MRKPSDKLALEPVAPAETHGAFDGPPVAAVVRVLEGLLTRPLSPGLHVVATPIGHLGDMSLRAVATLAGVDRIYCEDTRHSRPLLAHYGIAKPLAPYHEHNAAAARPAILAALDEGQRIALISDAGTPLVSDPGYKLVRAVLDAGHRVTAVPGASAVLAALSLAGLPTGSFHFTGFLPSKAEARRTRLESLLEQDATVVFFEAPGRVAETLTALAALAPTREVALARELTKLHETVMRGPANLLAEQVAEAGVRGECVILVAPRPAAVARDIDDAVLRDLLMARLAREPMNAAVRGVAADVGVPRNRVYDLALALKRAQGLRDDGERS